MVVSNGESATWPWKRTLADRVYKETALSHNFARLRFVVMIKIAFFLIGLFGVHALQLVMVCKRETGKSYRMELELASGAIPVCRVVVSNKRVLATALPALL